MSKESLTIINNLIEKKDFGSVIYFLDISSDLNNRELRIIIEKLIQEEQGILIIDNLEKFKGIESREVFYLLMQLYDLKTIISRFKIFKDFININDLLIELIKSGEKDIVLRHIAKFRISKRVLLEMTIKSKEFLLNNTYNVSDFINELKLISEEEDAFYLRDKNRLEEIIRYKKLDFDFNQIEYYSKTEFAFSLISNNLGSIVVNNVDRFNEKEILDIALYLVNFGKSWLALKHFVGKNRDCQKKILFEIIRTGNSVSVFSLFRVRGGNEICWPFEVSRDLKEELIVEMVKQRVSVVGFFEEVKQWVDFPDIEESIDIPMNGIGGYVLESWELEKIFKKNGLGSPDNYLSYDDDDLLSTLIVEDSKIFNIIEKLGDKKNFFYKTNVIFDLIKHENYIFKYFLKLFLNRNEAVIKNNCISGITVSSFLLSCLLLSFEKTSSSDKLDNLIKNFELLSSCYVYNDFYIKECSIPDIFNESLKEELVFHIIESGNLNLLIENLEIFKCCYSVIVHLLIINDFDFLFKSIHKIQEIIPGEKDIYRFIADMLITENSIDLLAFYFDEFGHYYESLIPVDVLNEQRRWRREYDLMLKEDEFRNNSGYNDCYNQSGLGFNYGCEAGPCERCDNLGCGSHPDN